VHGQRTRTELGRFLRCSVVTTEEACKLVEVLEDAGAFMQSPAQFSYELSYAFSPSGRSHDEVAISLAPASCTIRVSE
jgi:hypothetical protein